MDSITQALLGATTFSLIKDREIGKKSLLIGAIAGTLPDLDVFLAPLFNDVAFLTVHRSVSHSVLLAVVFSVILGMIFHRIYKKKQSQVKWISAFFLAIGTHSMLDWCTTYGTKLLSPFNAHLFSTNNIHVFEPIYTLILLIGVGMLVFRSVNAERQRRMAQLTLLLSTLYLAWTFVSKGIANNQFVKELNRQEIQFEKLLVSPTPLNSILWHGIAKTADGYYLATYSLFDTRDQITFEFKPSDNYLIDEISKNKLVKYYLQYTDDFPLIEEDSVGNIKIYAIKFGPINYEGKAEFVYPLTFSRQDLEEEAIVIDYARTEKGPVKDYGALFRRIGGI